MGQHQTIRPEAADGRCFRAAPTSAWASTPGGGGNGRTLLIGRRPLNRNGSLAARSGRTILTDSRNGSGAWVAIDAPVTVPNPEVNHCQNCSSPLLSSAHGKQVLKIATDLEL